MRDSFKVLVVVRDRHPRRSPALRSDATQGVPEVGRFSEQEWGDSDERHQRDLSTRSYRIPERLRRLVQARDQHCTFPLCHRPASKTDTDHRIPWPHGSTSEAKHNLQLRYLVWHDARRGVRPHQL